MKRKKMDLPETDSNSSTIVLTILGIFLKANPPLIKSQSFMKT